MNLPISAAAAVIGAAKLAQGIAQGVSGAIGFHDVLSQPSEAETGEALQQLTEAIGQRLSGAGIEVNQELPIGVTDDGQLRVDSNHPRAAEIESLLNSDDQITAAARRIALSGSVSVLTIPAGTGNIAGGSGGYPNW